MGLLYLCFTSTPLKSLNSHCNFFFMEKRSGTFTMLPIVREAETRRASAVVGARGVLTCVLTQAARVIPALIDICKYTINLETKASNEMQGDIFKSVTFATLEVPHCRTSNCNGATYCPEVRGSINQSFHPTLCLTYRCSSCWTHRTDSPSCSRSDKPRGDCDKSALRRSGVHQSDIRPRLQRHRKQLA